MLILALPVALWLNLPRRAAHDVTILTEIEATGTSWMDAFTLTTETYFSPTVLLGPADLPASVSWFKVSPVIPVGRYEYFPV